MAETQLARRIPAFSALRYRDFRILWIGLLFSSTTMMFQFFAQSWLILDLTNSPLQMGILGLIRGAAMLLFGLWGGALADRMERRQLLMLTQSWAAAISIIIALLVVTDHIVTWLAFTLIFIGAAVQSFDQPTRQALIPELVDRKDIPNAVSLATAAGFTSWALGPSLAGFIIDAIGVGGAYGVSIAGNAAVITSLLLIHHRSRPARRTTSMLSDIGGGIRYSIGHRTILWVMTVILLSNGLGMPVMGSLSPFWFRNVLGLSATGWGAMATMWGLAAVGAGYFWASRGNFSNKGNVFLANAVGFGLSLTLFGLVRWLPLVGVAQIALGVTMTTSQIAATTIIQLIVPNEVRGRIMSLYMLNQSLIQVNGIGLGALSQWLGIELIVPAVGIAVMMTTSSAVLGVPALRQLNRAVAAQTAT